MDPQDGRADTVEAAVAVLLGSAVVAWRLVNRVARPARNVAAGLLSIVVDPVAEGSTAERGRALRAQGARLLVATVEEMARRAVEVVLPALDVTGLVLRYADLDRIAAALDVDAVVDGVDVDAIVARVDVDAIVARVDVDAIVAQVDVDAVVSRVDLDAIVDRIDVEAVAAKLDLDRLAAGLDLQAIVDRINLDAAAARLDADAVVARVDLDAIVRRLDLVGIAQSVIDAIDLPEIVRESTGALSSDAVRAVRVESRKADDRVASLVDRLLRRSTNSAPVMP